MGLKIYDRVEVLMDLTGRGLHLKEVYVSAQQGQENKDLQTLVNRIIKFKVLVIDN